jgi:hypothetical protein
VDEPTSSVGFSVGPMALEKGKVRPNLFSYSRAYLLLELTVIFNIMRQLNRALHEYLISGKGFIIEKVA